MRIWTKFAQSGKLVLILLELQGAMLDFLEVRILKELRDDLRRVRKFGVCKVLK